jgi:hypothetical protein
MAMWLAKTKAPFFLWESNRKIAAPAHGPLFGTVKLAESLVRLKSPDRIDTEVEPRPNRGKNEFRFRALFFLRCCNGSE